MDLYSLTFYGLMAVVLLLKGSQWISSNLLNGTKGEAKGDTYTPAFKSLRNRYLIVFLLFKFADWMQVGRLYNKCVFFVNINLNILVYVHFCRVHTFTKFTKAKSLMGSLYLIKWCLIYSSLDLDQVWFLVLSLVV